MSSSWNIHIHYIHCVKTLKEKHFFVLFHENRNALMSTNAIDLNLKEYCFVYFCFQRNLSFPNAKYFCRLCEYHLDRPTDCDKHVDESRHKRKKEVRDMIEIF